MCAQFKLDFTTAHREFRNQSAQQSGSHSANMMIEQGREETMQDTVDTIAQLATATASDCGTVATFTTTNAKLATQFQAAQAQIAQLKDEIATLKNKTKPDWLLNYSHSRNPPCAPARTHGQIQAPREPPN
jgi:outer membrane receptor for Fe3+-dicitrate